MGNFCSNCGHELSGNFCGNCGQSAEKIQNLKIENNYVKQLNGVDIDILQLIRTYKEYNINAIKHIKDLTGASLTECTEFTKKVFQDKNALAEANAKCREYEEQGIPFCPKCHSTSLSANQKGFSLGKAAAGWVLAGPVGLIGGMFGRNRIKITCLNCGNKFDIQKK